MSYIVGILGMAGAGKDEIGKIFTEEYNFKRHAFGDEVKKEYAESIGAPLEDMFNENKHINRPGIIAHGEGKRQNYPEYWIDLIDGEITKDFEKGQPVVITDIRRVAEVNYIFELKEKYGKDKIFLIEIERSEENGQDFDEDPETSKALIYARFKNAVDIKIFNNSGQKELGWSTQQMIENDIMKEKK